MTIKTHYPNSSVLLFDGKDGRTITLRTPNGLIMRRNIDIDEISPSGVTLMTKANYAENFVCGQVVKIYNPILLKTHFARINEITEDGYSSFSRSIASTIVFEKEAFIDINRQLIISIPSSTEILQYVQKEAENYFVWDMATCTYRSIQ